MSYCLYLRKSRADLDAEARGEGETLARHEKALLELGRRQSLKIDRIYREIVSGETIAARPVMQQLLSEIEQGMWEGVLVMEVERLARGDTIDQGIVAQTFRFSGTKIITPLKTYDPNNEFDEEYFEFGLFMSRREYKTINRRLQRGRIASVREGKFVGSVPPFGYTRVKLDHDRGFTLKPNPEQAPIVKIIFSLFAYGEQQPDGTTELMSIPKIARKLNQLSIPAGKKKEWVYASIRDMLQNPVYIGKIRWSSRPLKKRISNGRLVKERPRANEKDVILADGLHEPLVDNKTWELVQQRFRQNPGRPCPNQYPVQNPLAGLVVCGVCGHRMVRRPYRKANEPDFLLCAAPSCKNVSSRLDYVEQLILTVLQDWLGTYPINPGDVERRSPFLPDMREEALKRAKKELLALKKQQDSIYELLEKGIYSDEVFLQRSRTIQQKMEEVQARLPMLEAQAAPCSPPGAHPICTNESIWKQYEEARTAEEKNNLLKTVIEKAVYTKTVNGRWNNRADEFELILYPKLPPKKV